MFTQKNQSLLIALGLILAILITRFNHFGDHVHFPDATLAVLFLGGLLIARKSWLGLAIGAAFAMDFYAIGFKGVSDYCMSLGYWGLIPTYAAVWGAGRWLASRHLAKNESAFSLVPYALVAWAAVSLAFVLSNAFWYVFSDKVTTLTLVQFVHSVAQYYTPYTSYAMMYVGLAWLANRALISLSNNSNATSAH